MAELDIALFNTLDADDEKALAQLGAAVILCWDRISHKALNEIVDLVPKISGIRCVSDASARIERLVLASRT